ncbi:MAG: hypothetical protein ACT4PE_17655 [Candidatus Eiseniibacteriota bacterium]
MRASISLLALAAVASAGLSPAPAGGEPADPTEVVARVIEAHGGEALDGVTGFRARGSVLSAADGLSGKVRIAVRLDGALRVEIRWPQREEVRILAGRLAWHGGSARQRPADREMADSMRLQLHRLAAPFELAGLPADSLEALEPSPEGWSRIARRWDARTRTVYEVDDTGRIRRILGELLTGGDDTMDFLTESSDFREVEGVLFPFRTTTVIQGEAATETILERVTLEENFAADEFSPAGAPGEI